jgi:hypothetical protein
VRRKAVSEDMGSVATPSAAVSGQKDPILSGKRDSREAMKGDA